jgi:hypothetical protein
MRLGRIPQVGGFFSSAPMKINGAAVAAPFALRKSGYGVPLEKPGEEEGLPTGR